MHEIDKLRVFATSGFLDINAHATYFRIISNIFPQFIRYKHNKSMRSAIKYKNYNNSTLLELDYKLREN